MQENVDILLNRREEIRNQINKLEKEYKALGEVLTDLYRYKKAEKENKDYERE